MQYVVERYRCPLTLIAGLRAQKTFSLDPDVHIVASDKHRCPERLDRLHPKQDRSLTPMLQIKQEAQEFIKRKICLS